MKRRMIILVILSFLLGIQSIQANSDSTLKKLNEIADDALQFTKLGRFSEAKQALEQFGKIFTEEAVGSKSLTMDELRIIAAVHYEALKTLNAVRPDQNEAVKWVTAFRLATDAVTSEYQPLWVEMEQTIMNSYHNVKSAAEIGDSVLYNQELNQFLANYNMIQPSIQIDLPPVIAQKIDSKITYLDRNRSSFSEQSWIKTLEEIEKDLQALFNRGEKDSTDPSIWWVIGMTGGIIVTTLSYVSWRKYQGQKAEKKRRRKKQND